MPRGSETYNSEVAHHNKVAHIWHGIGGLAAGIIAGAVEIEGNSRLLGVAAVALGGAYAIVNFRKAQNDVRPRQPEHQAEIIHADFGQHNPNN